PLRERPMVIVVVSTIAVSLVLRNAALNLAGPNPLRLPPLFARDMVPLGPVRLPSQLLAVIVMTGVLLLVQYLFFTRTRLGKMMQATAQDAEAARLMGIPVGRMVLFTFMAAAALAAACGFMLAPIVFIYPDMGGAVLIKAWLGAEHSIVSGISRGGLSRVLRHAPGVGRIGTHHGRGGRATGALVAVGLLLAVPLLLRSDYWMRVANNAAVTMLLALGLDFVWGRAGQLSFAQAGFFAIGAYASALAALTLKLPVLAAMAIAAAAGAGAALAV